MVFEKPVVVSEDQKRKRVMNYNEISINEIRVGYHPRKGFKGVEELKEQIQANGLLEPLRVRPENDAFIVIDGNRRFIALQELGNNTVPCIIENIDERIAAHQSYVLNAGDYRRKLNPIEVSLHIREMRERFAFSVKDLVDLGYAKDDQTIYNKLSLLTLPEETQNKIAEGYIHQTVGYKLAKVKDPDLQSRATQILVKIKNRSVRKTEKIIKNLNDSANRNKDEKEASLPAREGDVPGVFFHDSNDMSEFEDGSIPLIVVSPNYGVGMEFEEGLSFEEHKADLERCLPEWGRKLMPGGYLCMNFGDIHNFGSKNATEPEIQLTGQIFQDLLRPLNIRLRDIKIWEKGMTFMNNLQVLYPEDTEHTSYRSLHNFEYIYIFKKDGKREVPYDLDVKSRISQEEWKEWVAGIWRIAPVKKQKDHPAQFPEELPRRFISMFSYKGDIVVDTALGSGTTIKVARELGRKGFGYERDLRYKPVIMKKLGIKEGDLKEKEETTGDSTTEEKTSGVIMAIEKFLPEILAEAKDKGERISRISFLRKPALTKNEIIADTVPGDDDLPPTSPPQSQQVAIADDYEDGKNLLPGKPSAEPQGPILIPNNKEDISSHLNTVILGDCLEKLKDIPDNSLDQIVTDPPYGLKFMGKDWDKAVPAVEILKESIRVLKPGAFAYIMCSPRQDCLAQMIMRLKEAGFDTNFTSLFWTYASGFPKAQNISKTIDKKLATKREITGSCTRSSKNCEKSNSLTEEIKRFEGAYGGFQPKPAVEVILVVMKPMDTKTYVEQALQSGKGVTWLDDCRIPANLGEKPISRAEVNELLKENGRFPANLLVSDNVLNDGKDHKVGKMTPAKHKRTKTGFNGYQGTCYGKWNNADQPLGETYGDSGGFARFFSLDAWAEKNLPFLIVPKTSKKEKGNRNTHPTVKPIKLMAYLITMGSREGEVVLDPFAGSGTTCIAAKMLKRKFIGIEINESYYEIAEARLENAVMAEAA